MNQIFSTSLQAIASGLLISIGCLVCKNVGGTAGAFLFSIALLTIVAYGLPLFTGKVGYNMPIADLLFILFFNSAGALLGSLMFTAYLPVEASAVRFLVPIELLFFKSVGCGCLMFVAVDRKDKPYITALAVAVFILCGFEHCIADVAYLGPLIMVQPMTSAIVLSSIILGNAVGVSQDSL